jgi:hypothetical protein
MLENFKAEQAANDIRKKEYKKEIDELVKDEQERKFQNDNLDKEIADLTIDHANEIRDIENKNEKELIALRGNINDKEHELSNLYNDINRQKEIETCLLTYKQDLADK